MIVLYWYPRCGTCKKAKAWLEAQQIAFTTVDMIQHVPTKEELVTWMTQSGLPLRRFFNTSGIKYRELGLKEKVADYSLEEAAEVLATDGMLIKRPILIKDNRFLAIGFKENEYKGVLN